MRIAKAAFIVAAAMLVNACGSGASRLYYSERPLATVVSIRDYGYRLTITEYSRAYDTKAKRFVIQRRLFAMMPSAPGQWKMHNSDGRACGTWAVTHASQMLSLMPLGKPSYYRDKFIATDEKMVEDAVAVLSGANREDNLWLRGGGRQSINDIDTLASFGRVFPCKPRTTIAPARS